MPVTVLQPNRPRILLEAPPYDKRQRLRRESIRIPLSLRDISLWERETNHQPAAHPLANLRRLAAPPPSRGRRLTVCGSRRKGGGAQMGKRRLMNHDSGLAALCDTTPNSSSRAVVACCLTLSVKIATASTSREIFLVNDYDGVFKDRVTLRIAVQRRRRKSIRIPLSASQTSPFGKGGLFISGCAANPPESLCLLSQTSPFEKGGLTICGFAAIGILMTLFQ